MKSVIFIVVIIPFFLQAQTTHKISLYYQHDAYVLTKKQFKKIDSLQQIIRTSDSVVVKVSGYANAYGADSYNLQLSRKRAVGVASLLDQDDAIKILSFGELESISAKSRRVDVVFSSYTFEKEKNTIEGESQENSSINNFSNLEVGDKIVLKGLLFYGGSDKILSESNSALQELYQYLNKNQDIHVKLIGHICCHGNANPKKDGYNNSKQTFTLSKDRASAIYGYLIRHGISDARLDYEGRAYLEPLGKGDKYDRRVEIEIIE